MTRRPPVITRFLAHLACEADREWAGVKAKAFASICEALADEEGLPRFEGLRQIERGHFDARLAGGWKPVFVEVYQQWLGFLLEHRARPRLLSLGWWFCEPRFASRWPGQAGLLLSPAILAGAILATALLAGWHGTLSLREQRLQLEHGTKALNEACLPERLVETRSLELLQGRASDEELDHFLALSGARVAARTEVARIVTALRSAVGDSEQRLPRWPLDQQGERSRPP